MPCGGLKYLTCLVEYDMNALSASDRAFVPSGTTPSPYYSIMFLSWNLQQRDSIFKQLVDRSNLSELSQIIIRMERGEKTLIFVKEASIVLSFNLQT